MSGDFYAAGKGGAIDFAKALDCWRAAVTKKPWMRFEVPPVALEALPTGFANLMSNIGVRESENAIGNSYRGGRGVDKHQQTAAQVREHESTAHSACACRALSDLMLRLG